MQLIIDYERMEITCGEDPCLVLRYDTTTGEIIPVGDLLLFIGKVLTHNRKRFVLQRLK